MDTFDSLRLVQREQPLKLYCLWKPLEMGNYRNY